MRYRVGSCFIRLQKLILEAVNIKEWVFQVAVESNRCYFLRALWQEIVI